MNVLLLLCSCLWVSVSAKPAIYYDLEDAADHFKEFVDKFGKEYADESEEEERFQIFKENLAEVNSLNERSKHAVFGISMFMDLSNEEFIRMYTTDFKVHGNLSSVYCPMRYDSDIPYTTPPESLDWRTSGIVSPVKNQNSCGSCYSFSATGYLESQYIIKYRQMLSLSEQQIIDCDPQSSGCHGGFMSTAFQYLMSFGGSITEENYPYINNQGQCYANSGEAIVRVNACYSYQLSDQEVLKRLLYLTGPVSVGVKATNFHKYSAGIFTDDMCGAGEVNHAVLLVGYGTENGIPYWIIKNSWSTQFGEDGYIRIQRNNVDGCGILSPIMATATIA